MQQQRFLAVLEKREAKHLEAEADHSQCATCELFSTVIPDNRRLLREYTEAYNRAKRGQDE